MSNFIILRPEDFKSNDIVCKNLEVEKNKKSLVLGCVKNDYGELIEEAVVMIYKQFFDGENWRRKRIGFVTTNERGEFAVLLPKNNFTNYILEVFSPINCG